MGLVRDALDRPIEPAAPIAISLSVDQTGNRAAIRSHVAVTGTACPSEPSKDIATTRRENTCCSTALPKAIGRGRL